MYTFKNIKLSTAIRPVDKAITLLISMIGICLLFLSACKQDNLRTPLENDGVAPGQVTKVHVENLHGGARIGYALPADIDLLYIQADYEIRKGIKEEKKASFYDNSMVIQGFGDTIEYPVQLYAVDRSGNKSEPVTVMVKPLLPPVRETYNSLSYAKDFGGITVTFQNPTQANIVITAMTKDSTGDWVDYDKDYTSQASRNFSVRGLSPVPTTFGVFVQDRWDNHSDTLVKTLTPLYEEELDKSKFKPLVLSTDAENIWDWPELWDNKMGENDRQGWRSASNLGLPVSFTIDLGVKAKLSRLRTWQVHDGREYSSSNIKQFQLWGSNDPNPDGSWDSWTLMGNYEIVKPSGLPAGQISNEDVETAAAGDESIVPLAAPAVRYVRFKIISTYASPPNSTAGGAWITEVAFWGQPEP